MAQIVTNIIQNSLSGMVAGAVTTVGNYAGDAVSGIGNLIEAKGQSVGDGIAKKFEGWGSGFTTYGNTVRSATAPNAGYPSKTKKKAVTATKKPGTATKKSLPSIPEQKQLTAPPKKSVQEKGPSQGTYNSSVAPYKQAGRAKRSNYAASVAAMSTVTAKTSKTGQTGKMGNTKLNQAQKSLSPIKSSTNAAGKVVIDKRSMPGKIGKAASVTAGNAGSKEPYKGPIPLGGNSGLGDGKPKNGGQSGGQSKGGYQGPLNLSGIGGGSGPKSQVNGQKNEKKPAPSKPASVAGGNKTGGYAGPLDLGSLA